MFLYPRSIGFFLSQYLLTSTDVVGFAISDRALVAFCGIFSLLVPTDWSRTFPSDAKNADFDPRSMGRVFFLFRQCFLSAGMWVYCLMVIFCVVGLMSKFRLAFFRS